MSFADVFVAEKNCGMGMISKEELAGVHAGYDDDALESEDAILSGWSSVRWYHS